MSPFFLHKTKNVGFPFRTALHLLPVFCLFIVVNSASITAQEIDPNRENMGIVRTRPDLTNPIVVKIFYTNRENLNYLAKTIDIWETNHTGKFVIAGISQAQIDYLLKDGYQVVCILMIEHFFYISRVQGYQILGNVES